MERCASAQWRFEPLSFIRCFFQIKYCTVRAQILLLSLKKRDLNQMKFLFCNLHRSFGLLRLKINYFLKFRVAQTRSREGKAKKILNPIKLLIDIKFLIFAIPLSGGQEKIWKNMCYDLVFAAFRLIFGKTIRLVKLSADSNEYLP